MVLHNMGKENDKLKNNNTLERNNMATNQMGIMN